MNIRLDEFVRRALEKGLGKDKISEALEAAGWRVSEIRSALGAYSDTSFPVAVPKPAPYISAKEAFVYLVLFAALYATAWHLVALCFLLIDRTLGDFLTRTAWNNPDRSMRWNISALIIFAPLFLLTFLSVQRRISRDPTRRNSWVRKWLTYLTLFVAVIIIAGDLMALVYNFLNGDLTLSIVLKTLAVAVVAGGTFAFFYSDIRTDEDE